MFLEKAIDGPGGENGAFAELAGPIEAEDAGGVVVEDWDLVGAEFHARTMWGRVAEWKDLCTTFFLARLLRRQLSTQFHVAAS